MNIGPQTLLVGAVGVVGVLHTMVPDHWVPITVIARRRGWSRQETARAAIQAGAGHVLSTLVIGFLVWILGVGAARRFGATIDSLSSFALMGFGLWVVVLALHEMHHTSSSSHRHDYDMPAQRSVIGDSSVVDADQRRRSLAALLLILGSSPMVEGIPAFFAAARYGFRLIAAMSAVFAASTILTYVFLCVSSTVALRRFSLGAFERYGEVVSGAAIAVVGLAFWLWSGR